MKDKNCEWASVQKHIYAYNERGSFDEVKDEKREMSDELQFLINDNDDNPLDGSPLKNI